MRSSEIDIYDEAEFGSWIKKINVTLAEKNYCNMIKEHNRQMDNRKNINKNKYLEGLSFGVRLRMKGEIYPHLNGRKAVVLSINTSEKTRGKAYKFMNTFINCIFKIGGRVYVDKTEDNDNTMFTLLESRYKCNLYEDTNLVDKELDNKIREKLKDTVQELDKSKKYRMDLEFCEDLIKCEFEIDSYEIPEEALPPYQRGKVLKGKEKMYELLDYRVDSVKNIVKEYGIKLGSCNIKGTPFMKLNKMELKLEEEEDTQLDNSCKRKKEKTFTVNMIMPSFSGFIQNLIKVSEDIEKKIETELENAFDNKKEYDKY